MGRKKQRISVMDIAFWFHFGQKRESTGNPPYIIHPLTVGKNAYDYMVNIGENNLAQKALIVGILHDVIEDTQYSKDDLKKDFDYEIYQAVVLLTHTNGSYSSYIKKLVEFDKSENVQKLAMIVKLHDLLHNTMGLLDGHKKDKYQLAIEMLNNHIENWKIH